MRARCAAAHSIIGRRRPTTARPCVARRRRRPSTTSRPPIDVATLGADATPGARPRRRRQRRRTTVELRPPVDVQARARRARSAPVRPRRAEVHAVLVRALRRGRRRAACRSTAVVGALGPRPAAPGAGRPTRRGSSGTVIRRNAPCSQLGTAVAGTIAAPSPRTRARRAGGRRRSRPAARSVMPAAAAARSSTRRRAVPVGRQQQRYVGELGQATSSRARRAGGSVGRAAAGPRRTAARSTSSGSSTGRWTTAASSWPDSTLGHERRWCCRRWTIDVHVRVVRCEQRRGTAAPASGRWCRSRRCGPRRDTSSSQRRHVGGDVVELAQDPPGPLDDARALLGEAAAGPGRRA